MRLLPLLFLVPLAFSASACRKPRVTVHRPPSVVPAGPNTMDAGTVITAPGSYYFADSEGERHLTVTSASLAVHCTFETTDNHPDGSRRSGTAVMPIALKAAGDPWFIYVESKDRLWFFNANGDLDYHVQSSGTSESGRAVSDKQLRKEAPKVPAELIRRLPDELKQLFPSVPPADGPRPSI